ncbi:hypothetical protein MW887_004841 [Aspergillus wentii]|nr:hypothetical protein MW887_004841 [Aspergillus wentii]
MSDMRRHDAVKRKVDRLENSEDLLQQLIQVLRCSDSDRIDQLLELIRDNASMEQIQAFLEQKFTAEELEKTPELADLQQQLAESSVPMRRRVLDVRQLVDIPVVRVPAKPWTTVTDDDDLVSHLVSLWLTWTQPWLNWLDRGVFLAAMQAGQLETEFCSPFLVNAILAEACFYSDYAEVFTVAGDLMTRGAHFSEEARRLFEQEEGPATLATVQGLGYLFVQLSLMGKERLGCMYFKMAVKAAEEYDAAHPARNDGSVEQNAINHALWGIFNVSSLTSVAVMKYVPMTRPRRPRPWDTHDSPGDVWSPYPRHEDPIAGHILCAMARWTDVCCIANEIGRVFFDSENKPPGDQMSSLVDHFHRQLQEWQRNLPACFDVETATVPHILAIHMFCHTIILQLLSLIRHDDTLPPSTINDAKSTSLWTARHVASLITIHRQRWGIDRMGTSTSHWVIVSLFALLEALDTQENRTAFITLCTVARSFAHRYPFGAGLLRMIQLNAAQSHITLPEETDALFADFEEETRGRTDPAQFSSLYPNFGAAVRPDQASDTETDQFLERWDGLNLIKTTVAH